MKYQVLFSLKNNDKVFMNVICCSVIGALIVNSPTYNFLFSTEICMALHSFIDGISGNEGKHFVMILISCAE